MKKTYDEKNLKRETASWVSIKIRMQTRFRALQALSSVYSAWIEIQQDADDVYQEIIMGQHNSPQTIIDLEIALHSLLDQESKFRRDLQSYQPDTTRRDPRPAQSRDQQYGAQISSGLRSLTNRLNIEAEKLKMRIKSVEAEIDGLKKLKHCKPKLRHVLQAYFMMVEVLKELDTVFDNAKVASRVAARLAERDRLERLDRIKSNRRSIFDLHRSRKVHQTIEIEESEANYRANRRLIRGTEEEVVDVLVEPISEPTEWERAIAKVRAQSSPGKKRPDLGFKGLFDPGRRKMPFPVPVNQFVKPIREGRWLS
jgi:hypothetical protein